jgi:antitoxin PrlF
VSHMITSVAESGRVLIPSVIRKLLNIEVGDALVLRVKDGEIHLVPQNAAMRRAKELVRKRIVPGRSLSQELIEERRNEAQREQQ